MSWHLILKISLSIMLCWAVYYLFLRRLTFFNWNRWFLLLMPWLMAAASMVDTSRFFPQEPAYFNWIPAVATSAESANPSLDILIPCVLLGGMLVLFTRMFIRFWSLKKLAAKASLVHDGPIRIMNTSHPVSPFTFHNTIYIHIPDHLEEDLKEIIRHEIVHIRQRHTVDMLAGEIFCMLNWYNPFAWMLHASMKENLEFIADREVLSGGVDPRQYQYLLLKVMGNHQFSAVNNFNALSLKKRIIMMNKKRSGLGQLLRFGLIVPVAAISMMSFRNEASVLPNIVSYTAEAVDTIPGPPAPPKLPANVKWIEVKNERVQVTLKDGTTERYDFGNDSEKAAFEKKYGKIAPPPPPPVPPSVVDGKDAPAPPVPPVPPVGVQKPGKKAKIAPPPPPAPPKPPVPPAPAEDVEI